VVLFQHPSRVEGLEIPEGTELSVQQISTSEDGPEPDYTVFEEVPPCRKVGARYPTISGWAS
jgi:hypothetical protein